MISEAKLFSSSPQRTRTRKRQVENVGTLQKTPFIVKRNRGTREGTKEEDGLVSRRDSGGCGNEGAEKRI